jgi:hypothetical protein
MSDSTNINKRKKSSVEETKKINHPLTNLEFVRHHTRTATNRKNEEGSKFSKKTK